MVRPFNNLIMDLFVMFTFAESAIDVY